MAALHLRRARAHDGIGFTVIAVGLFAVAEIAGNLESREPREVFTGRIPHLMPSRRTSGLRLAHRARHRAGRGVRRAARDRAGAASFAAYMLEKKLARDP